MSASPPRWCWTLCWSICAWLRVHAALLSADYSTIQSRRIFLFLRDHSPPAHAPQLYGKAGTLYWTLIPPTSPTLQHFLTTPAARAELDSQRLPLHTLTDLRSAKQTDTLRHPSLARIPDTTCFALSSSLGIEMNLTATTVEDKGPLVERSHDQAQVRTQTTQDHLIITAAAAADGGGGAGAGMSQSPSPSPSPALIIRGPTPNALDAASSVPPAPPLSPTSLRRILLAGAFFNKFDLDVHGRVSCSSIFLWAEGVGKQGDLYWVEARPHPGFVPPPSSILPPSHSLPLAKITDFMLKKKSPALKASSAPDACCFALVASDKSTLNLECESKEVCKNWRDGLINMLLTAGQAGGEGGCRRAHRPRSAMRPLQSHPSPRPPPLAAAFAALPSPRPRAARQRVRGEGSWLTADHGRRVHAVLHQQQARARAGQDHPLLRRPAPCPPTPALCAGAVWAASA